MQRYTHMERTPPNTLTASSTTAPFSFIFTHQMLSYGKYAPIASYSKAVTKSKCRCAATDMFGIPVHVVCLDEKSQEEDPFPPQTGGGVSLWPSSSFPNEEVEKTPRNSLHLASDCRMVVTTDHWSGGTFQKHAKCCGNKCGSNRCSSPA